METIKKNKNGRIGLRTIQKLMATVLFVMILLVGCSKDDNGEQMSPIMAKSQTYEFDAVNDCSTSIGDGTAFYMKIPYTAPAGVTIEKVIGTRKVSNGDTEDFETPSNLITDKDNIITWATCFTFGSQTWVEYDVRLKASDGNTSNAVKVKVNKPSGAN